MRARTLADATRIGRAGPGGGAAEAPMNSIIYIVGLIVVILVVLSFLGLR